MPVDRNSPLLHFDDDVCAGIRGEFTDYLDGAVPGLVMASIADHLDGCAACSVELDALLAVQQSLASLGFSPSPDRLQAQLRQAIAVELERGTHLSAAGRLRQAWNTWLAPAALRTSGAFAIALVLLGGLAWMFAAPISSVQANDDNQANLIAPRFLYSEVPPQPIALDRDVPLMVEAKVDTEGRVYDYSILTGPTDDAARSRVEQNLLSSVFKPATLFGAPVRGHVLLTYTGVSVQG